MGDESYNFMKVYCKLSNINTACVHNLDLNGFGFPVFLTKTVYIGRNVISTWSNYQHLKVNMQLIESCGSLAPAPWPLYESSQPFETGAKSQLTYSFSLTKRACFMPIPPEKNESCRGFPRRHGLNWQFQQVMGDHTINTKASQKLPGNFS